MLKFLKNFIMRKYDLIERQHAPYFVTMNCEKLEEISQIIKKRVEWVQNNQTVKPHIKEKIYCILEDLELVTKALASNRVFKLAEVEQKTEEQLESEEDAREIIEAIATSENDTQ